MSWKEALKVTSLPFNEHRHLLHDLGIATWMRHHFWDLNVIQTAIRSLWNSLANLCNPRRRTGREDPKLFVFSTTSAIC